MRKALSLFAALLIAVISLQAQLPYVQSFESTAGYSSSSPFQIDVFNNDFFWRGIESDFNWQGTADLPGENGSFYIGVEDHDFIVPGEQWIKTDPINIYGYTNLLVDLSLASPNPSVLRFEKEDSVVVEYRIDGGPWIKIDHFGGADSIVVLDTTETGDPATIILGSVLYRDGALDGIGVDANDAAVLSDLTDYNYDLDALNGSGVTGCFLELRFRFSLEGPQEEVAVDHIRVNGAMSFVPAITSVVAGTQTACDPNTNTYSQDLVITYSSDPGSGTLDVNGQSFAITASPQTVTLTGLTADGLLVDVTAAFSDDGGCGFTAPGSFTAPVDCSPACAITALSAGTQSACNEITNTYNQEVIVTYENDPGTGSLIVNGQVFPITGSPQSCLLINLPANGLTLNVQASFSDDPGCNFNAAALFTAPASCASGCDGLGSAIHVEDFEDADYTGYSTSALFGYSLDSNDLFIRGEDADFNWKSVVSGLGASNYIGIEDHDFLGSGEQWLELDEVNITDYKGLRVSFKLVAPANLPLASRYEPDDYLIVEFDLDNSGTYTKIGEFRGFVPGGGQLFQDIGFDGIADGAVPNESAATYELSLDHITGSPVTGSSIKVRFRFSLEGAHEELAFDDIAVIGITGAGPAMPIASSDTICPGTSVQLSVTGEINDAFGWKWYTGDCGDVLVGTGNSITFTPAATITYYARGEGDCVDPGPCNSIRVVVGDFELPEISCPSNITVNTDPGFCHALVTYSAPVGSDNCSGPTILQTDGLASGSNFPEGTTTNTFEITDIAGQTATCSFDITVNDNEPPVASCQNIVVQLDGDGMVTIADGDVDGGSADVCSAVSFSATPTSFDCSNTGNNTVTLTVTDQSGNSSTCLATVVVVDDTPPTLICPPDISVNTDPGVCEALIDGSLTAPLEASDNCDAVLDYFLTGNPYGLFSTYAGSGTGPIGTVSIIGGSADIDYTLTDASGNSATCSFTITVEDNEPPVVTCPDDITVNTDPGVCSAVVLYEVGLSENCPIFNFPPVNAPELILGLPSGSPFPLGPTVNTYSFTDPQGNSDDCSFTVTVEDNEPPMAICQDLTIQLNGAGTATIIPSDIDNGSFDACGPVELEINDVGFIEYGCVDVGVNPTMMAVIDESDNVSICNVNITVQDNVAPNAVCQDVTVQLDVNGNGSITSDDVDNNSTDACGIADLSLDVTNFSCSDVGNNSVILTVTDVNSNVSTCGAVITVQDNVPPVAECSDVTVGLDASGNASITEAQVDNGSSDACGVASLSLDRTSFACADIGDNTVVLTVTDVNGNVSSCSAVITVEGVIPTVTITEAELDDFCQGGTLVLTANASVPVSYSWSTTETTKSIEVSADGIYSVVVTSATGCIASASYTISGFDETALLSSYSILATGGDVSLEKFSAVNSGGVGVIPIDKRAKLKDNSHVTGFVKAAEIDIDASSTVGNPVLAPATVPLPPFIANPTISTNDVTVVSGTSVILGDNVYGKIDIKKDASVTFTSDNIFIDEIKLKEGSTISFNDCANLYINRKLDMGKTMTFNPSGEQVVIYIDNSVDIGLGSVVNARIFATGDISAKGKDSDPINMTGLFIADKLGSKGNVTWNWDLLCAPCPTSVPMTRLTPDALSQDEKFISLNAEVYPNPFMRSVTIRIDLPETKHVSLDIINIEGTTVATLFEGQLEGGSSYNFQFDAADLAEGAYIYRIVSGNEQITGKMILLK